MTMKIGPFIQETILHFRARINRLVDRHWDNDPFGTEVHATREEYLTFFEQAKKQEHPQIDALEVQFGFAINRQWLDELALHTQIVKKESDLAYPHGRVLYSLLRRMIKDQKLEFVTILETGTARGFSALCMAKALEDANVEGRIITVDVLSHLKRQIWNCIDDHDGLKSRAEILAPWSDLLRKIIFIQGDTLYTLPRLGLDRINFAFLDAQHIESSVLQEFEIIQKKQMLGDMIVFDDVTESEFPGVVKAVAKISQRDDCKVERLALSDQRGYAWQTKFNKLD